MKADLYHRRNLHVPLDYPISFANLKKVATVEGAPPITAEELLERAFTLTQNASWAAVPAAGVTPEPPQGGSTRSTIVGDMVEIEKAWLVRTPTGWDFHGTPEPAFVDRTPRDSGKGMIIVGAKPPPEPKR